MLAAQNTPNTEAAEAKAAAERAVGNTESQEKPWTPRPRAIIKFARTGNEALDSAIAAITAFDRDLVTPLSDAHSAAEVASQLAKRAIDAIPFPGELIRSIRPEDDRVMIAFTQEFSDGSTQRVALDPKTQRLDTADAIITYLGEDQSDAPRLLAILAEYDAAMRPAATALRKAKADEERREKAWVRARTKRDAMCDDMLKISPRPGHGRDAALKLEVNASFLEERRIKPWEIPDGYDSNAMLKAAYTDLMRLGKAPIPTPPSPSAERAAAVKAWIAARSKLANARAIYFDRRRADRAEAAAFYSSLPPAYVAPSAHYGVTRRWATLEDLAGDLLLTPEAREALMPGLPAVLEAVAKFSRMQQDVTDEQLEAASDAMYDAMDEVMVAQAPDAAALAEKMAIAAIQSDGCRLGFNDRGYVANALAYPSDEAFAPIQFYIDTLAMTGQEFDRPEFDASAWVKAYEAAGGSVVRHSYYGEGLLVINHPDDGRPLHDRETAAALRAELAADEWKYRSVHLWSDRDYLTEVVRRADVVTLAFDQEAGTVTAHVEHIDNTQGPYIPAAYGVRAGPPAPPAQQLLYAAE